MSKGNRRDEQIAAKRQEFLGTPCPEIRSESAERFGYPGMVTVWDEHGRIVGCMGVELWRALLIARVELFIPELGDPQRLALRQHDDDLRIAQPRHVRAESTCTDNVVTKSEQGRLINCMHENDRNRPGSEAGEGVHEQGADDPQDASATPSHGARGDAGSDPADAVNRHVSDEVAEQVLDAFGLTEEEREFIRSDADGYQAARKAAEEHREAFAEFVGRKLAGRPHELSEDCWCHPTVERVDGKP